MKLSEIINLKEIRFVKLSNMDIVTKVTTTNIYLVHDNNIVSGSKEKILSLNPETEDITEEEFISTVNKVESSDWMVLILKEGLTTNQL